MRTTTRTAAGPRETGARAGFDAARRGIAGLASAGAPPAGLGPTGLVVIGLAVGNAVLAASGNADAAAREQDPTRLAPPARRLVVSLADRRLVLEENGRALLAIDVAIGKASTPTPTGTFTVVSRLTDPTWYGPKQVVAPGPSNPLGNRWLGLSIKGFGIHGTNRPSSIGKAASHGCLRVRKADIERLFDLVRVGDVVEIRASIDAAAEPELAAALAAPAAHDKTAAASRPPAVATGLGAAS